MGQWPFVTKQLCIEIKLITLNIGYYMLLFSCKFYLFQLQNMVILNPWCFEILIEQIDIHNALSVVLVCDLIWDDPLRRWDPITNIGYIVYLYTYICIHLINYIYTRKYTPTQFRIFISTSNSFTSYRRPEAIMLKLLYWEIEHKPHCYEHLQHSTITASVFFNYYQDVPNKWIIIMDSIYHS